MALVISLVGVWRFELFRALKSTSPWFGGIPQNCCEGVHCFSLHSNDWFGNCTKQQ